MDIESSPTSLVKILLNEYLGIVKESPDTILPVCESTAYAIEYLVNRYKGKFEPDYWIGYFQDIINVIDKVPTKYREMMSFTAPLKWCIFVLSHSLDVQKELLKYSFSLPGTARRLYYNYIYLVAENILFEDLKDFVEGYLMSNKLSSHRALYILMKTEGNMERKITYIKAWAEQPEISRDTHIKEDLDYYAKGIEVRNYFHDVDKFAAEIIIDHVFRDSIGDLQLELDL